MVKDLTAPFNSSPDDRFSEILAKYLDAVDRGDRPDREALIAEYPDWAEQLRAFFADQDRLEQVTGPLREKGKVEAAILAYDFLEEISRGGMGVVLRCRDRLLNRDLAIKVLLDHFRDQPDLVRRFIEEARITGQLQHPFIVPVHKLGTLEDGRPYFAMKLVEGRTFADLLKERADPGQDLPRHLKVFEQICQTIAYAHSKGVIHRDLKPANVMVGQFGEIQVMDWGLAKVLDEGQPASSNDALPAHDTENSRITPLTQTQAGAVLGTYAYMPPEQARGELHRVSRRSDVFGLGAILCEILTGKPPYAGELAQVREQARAGGVADAFARLDACGADASLCSLAKSCLAPDPTDRPDDGNEVAEATTEYFSAAEQRRRLAEIARARAETETIEERKRVELAEAKVEAEHRRRKADQRRRRATGLLAASLCLLVVVAASFGLWYQQVQWTRDSEVAARKNATERDITTALAEVRLRREEGIKQADYPERWRDALKGARDAWKQAENALKLGEPTDELIALVQQARQQLEQDERDRQFFITLERRWLEASSLSHEDVRAPRDVSFLTRVFTDYGLDLDAMGPKDAADWIRKHPHRGRLIEEIDVICHLQATLGVKAIRAMQFGFRGVKVSKADWSRAEKIRQILDAVDDDASAFGTRWRAARHNDATATMIELARTLDVDKVSPRGAVGFANDLIGIQAFEQGYQLLRKVHQRHPSNFFVLQMLGILSVARTHGDEKGSLDEAIGYLQAALAIRGNNPATNQFLGLVYKAQGRHDEALRAALAGVEADPESAPAHHHLGTLYSEKKQWDKALACYQRATELDAVSALPYDALGQTFYEKGDHDKALECYDIALKREPTFAAIYVNRGNAFEKKNDLESAIQNYRKALDLFPNYGLAHNNLGMAYAKKNDLPRSLQCLRTAIACDPDLFLAYYGLGDLLLLQRDHEGALKAYEGPVTRFPKSPQTHYQLADLNLRVGRFFSAAEGFRKVIELQPTFPAAQGRLGIALAGLGQWDGAMAGYRLALEQLDPKAPGIERATLLNLLGTAHGKKGEWEKAIGRYQEALKLDGLRGQVHLNLGTAYKGLWKLDEAAEAFRIALEQHAANAMVHYEYASVLLELGDLEKTVAHARKAIELAPKRPEPYGLLAQVFLEKGDVVQCHEAAKQGKELLSPLDPDQGQLQVICQVADEFRKGDEVYPAAMRGEFKATDFVGRGSLAMVMALKYKKYAAATNVLAENFASDPLRANNVMMGGRYRGACFAVLAGTGQAEAEAKLTEQAKADFRKKALEWLRADLEAWRRLHQFALAHERNFPVFRVGLWSKDRALKNVRAPALEKLPEGERAEWSRFWEDVQAFGKTDSSPKEPKTNLAALRKLVRFPAVSVGFDLQYNTGKVRRDYRGNIIVPEKEIEKLLVKLKGIPEDGEHLIELLNHYSHVNDEVKLQETAQKAEKLLQPFLKSNKAKDARRIVEYCHVHNFLKPTETKAREAWLRRAVELDPDDWLAWSTLGALCQSQVSLKVLGGRLPEMGKPNEAKQWLHAGTVKAPVVNEAERIQLEARKCYDRAKKLAPRDEKQWNYRIGFIMEDIEWQQAFKVARGQAPLTMEYATPEWQAKGYKGGISLSEASDMLAEFCEAAECCPEHLGMQFFGMLHLIPRVKQRALARDPLKDKSPLLSVQEAQFLDDTMARLRKIGQKAQGEAAVYCDRMQAVLLMQFMGFQDFDKGMAKIEPVLRRILDADPKDDNASLFLEMKLTDQGNPQAGLELARKRCAQNPSVLNRYTLARALDHCGKHDEAAKVLEEALTQEPDNVNVLGGCAVLSLRKDDEALLKKAGELLDKARASIKPSDPPSLTEDIEFLQAVQRILSGQTVIGRLTLDILRTQNPHDRHYAEALKLSEP